MIGYEVWIMIRQLREQGYNITAIAQELELDRKTVRKALREPQHPSYQRPPKPSKLDPYKDHIRQRLHDHPRLSAIRLLDEVRKQGYAGGYTTVKDFVAQVKEASVVRAVVRFETQPGGQGQVDWAHFGTVILDGEERRLSCFILTLGYSRMRYVEFTLSMDTPTLIQCHLNAFAYLGGYPRELLYDNQAQVGVRKGDRIAWNPVFEDFVKHYGIQPRLCKPYRAQTKGKVEKSVSYVRGNFWEGRSFTSLQDVNAQAKAWCDEASEKPNATTHAPPRQRWREEGLQPFNARPAYVVTQVFARKVSRDCYVSFLGNKYSVPWQHAARACVVKLREGKLTVEVAGKEVATHEQRVGTGHVVRVKEHFQGLRATRNQPTQASSVQDWSHTPEVEARDLRDYDRVLTDYDGEASS